MGGWGKVSVGEGRGVKKVSGGEERELKKVSGGSMRGGDEKMPCGEGREG